MDERSLAPLTVVDADGVPTTISSIAPDTTAAELADAIGLAGLTIDGQPVAADAPIRAIDELRIGARLGTDAEGARTPTVGPIVDVAVVAGPACASWQSLPVGRHVVGRAPHAEVRIADPALELHHGLLDVASDGTVRFTQLAGAVPALVGATPVDADHEVVAGSRLRLGASVLVVRPSPATPNAEIAADRRPECVGPARPQSGLLAHPADPWRRIVQRAHRPDVGRDDETLQAPVRVEEPRMPPMTGLVGAAVAVAGALVIAAIVGSALFVIFAGVGAVAAVATWSVSAIGVWRTRRRLRRDHAAASAAFLRRLATLADVHARRLRRERSDVLDAICLVDDDPTALWSRRLRSPSVDDESGSPFIATIGPGTVRWSPSIERVGDLELALTSAVERMSRLRDVPIVMAIASGESIAIDGSPTSTMALARSIVVQLAVHSGPADWQLVVATDDADRWAWADWLPHGAIRSRHAAVLDGARLADELDEVDPGRRTLVVVDDPSLLLTRTGPLRRFLTRPGVSGLVVTGGEPVPAMCRRVHHVGETGRGSWIGDPCDTGSIVTGDTASIDAGTEVDVAGLSIAVADRVARRLAGLVDPEDHSGGVSMPTTISLTQLFGDVVARPDVIARRWIEGGEDPSPAAPLGRSADGVVDVDLVRDGPHGLIAGTTGAGKSELLRSLVVGLAVSVSPAHLNVVLVDYKGGSTFDACVRLPHTVGVVTDLDDGLAERALASLTAELHRRESLLRSVGAADLTAYRRGRHRPGIARLVVVIDEFAALAAELPGFLSALVGIAQRGRSLGVHLLLATQRPAGVVSDEIRANTNLRLALRLNDRGDAIDVVGDATPTTFGRSVPGRAAMRLGPDELVVFQSAWCTGPIVASTGRLTVERRGIDAGDAEAGDNGAGAGGSSELDVAVDSVVQAALELDLAAPHRPWIDPLPHPLPAELLGDRPGSGVIGLVDQPERQRRTPLRWRPRDGSLALVGSLGSGTTSTLIALAAATCRDRSPDDVHLYVIDARGDDVVQALAGLAHCGGVVRLTEDERLHRLVARLAAEIDQRCDGAATSDRDVVLMIDGWSSLRAALSTVERTDTFELLRRVVHDGPAVGVVTIVTDEGGTSLAAVPVADRWVFHLADPTVARGLGIARPPVGSGRPGALVVASSGHLAQVAAGAPGLAGIAGRDSATSGGPAAIASLPAIVTAPTGPVADRGSTRRHLLLGLGADDLEPDGLVLAPGDAVLIVGQPRTGVSMALERCVAAWRSALPASSDPSIDHGDRAIVRVDRHRALTPEQLEVDADLLVMIDDAHRVGDPDGVIASIVAGDHPHVTLLAGARADAVRSGYGHWTRAVAAGRCGLVMTSRSDPDGDVLGVTVPRRSLIPARPGLAWVVDAGPLRQIQLALPAP